jgi:two-component system chemotaxis response regulator CheB
VEVIHEVMAHRPTPILVMAYTRGDSGDDLPFRAIQAGAMEIVDKSAVLYNLNQQEAVARLVRLIKLAADIHLVPRSRRTVSSPTQRNLNYLGRGDRIQVVAVGASTGGPQALLDIFSDLNRHFPAPIVLVQHMGAEFIPHLVEWLNQELAIPLHLAQVGEQLQAGTIAIAPGGRHLLLARPGTVHFGDDKPVNSCCPSIDVLFQSVAEQFGSAALGILLTGMGEDGARGLQAIKRAGGKTIAQDEDSSIIFGMPRAAIEMQAVDLVLPLPQIGKSLSAWAALSVEDL